MENLDVNIKFKLISTNINSIPPYDGNRDALSNFVHRIDSMVQILNSFTADEYKILLIGQIKDKIIGSARRSILINGNPDTWPEIRKVLIDNHGEKNSVDELIDKIRVCRCDSTIEAFYNLLNTLLCRLNNASQFSGNSSLSINSESNARIALNSFKFGLPEPVKSIIVSRDPKTLKDAYDIIKSNGYLKYTNKRTNFFNSTQFNKNNNNFEHNVSNMSSYATQQHRQHNRENNLNNYVNQQNRQQFSNNDRVNDISSNVSQQHRPQYSNSNVNNSGRYNNHNSMNSFVQPSFNSNNSNQTNRTNRSSRNFYNQYNNNNNEGLYNNRNPPAEPMEIGVNENEQNFQLDGLRNYPI
ncbi:probable ATP-dependent RNA helicase ddx42 [Eurosta solidaginis]|uniref:probable ATP-dependent RNA helicase ddx42 n=1 Tax=Eurosta solidaginis TaxID=178769 RepID=UPI003530DB05